MLAKGNVWYVRYWEEYFDNVYVVYLLGRRHEPVVNGRTTLVSLGTGRKTDLFWAPYRLAGFARRIQPSHYVMSDLVFLWWTARLMKLFRRPIVYLMPVGMPE